MTFRCPYFESAIRRKAFISSPRSSFARSFKGASAVRTFRPEQIEEA